jgi:hypothetical protein
MILEIYTKNNALVETREIETTIAPRVGEVIDLAVGISGLQGITTLLVHDVHHILRDSRLTTLVKCHAASPEHHRRSMLEEHGWL